MSDSEISKTGNAAPKATERPANKLGMDSLKELALNLHWSWNHAADELW